MGARDRHDVELIDDDGAPAPGAAVVPRGAAARWVRRLWPVPVVVGLALWGWRGIGEQRVEADAERLRDVPGVVTSTVTAPLGTVEWGTGEATLPLWAGARTGDLLVGPVPASAGAWDLLAVRLSDGSEEWRSRIAESGVDVGRGTQVSCDDVFSDDGWLWCLVTSALDRPPYVATALLRAGADGEVERVRELPEGVGAALADGVLVTARVGEGAVAVGAQDASAGAVLWTEDVAQDDPQGPDGVPDVRVVGGHVWVGDGERVVSLDLATGAREGEGANLVTTRGDLVVETSGSSSTRAVDGSWETDGTPVSLGIDDGSVPGLVLLRAFDGAPAGVLRAVDVGTGQELWSGPGRGTAAGGDLLALDGLLLGSDGRSLWALDLEDGTERWTAEGGTDVGSPLMTDGRSVLRVELDPGSGDRVLAAYGLRDGRALWTTPLPEGAGRIDARHGLLWVVGVDQVLTLG